MIFGFFSLYKKILHTLPTAVIVFDKKGKVRFANAAFAGYFSSENKRRLKKTFCLPQNVYRLKALAQGVLKENRAQSGNVSLSLYAEQELHRVSLRMHVLPLDKKRCLGLVESVFERELAKELSSAHKMQQRLLPVGKEAGGVPYSYMYIPCREIGGDLPDVYEVTSDGRKNTFGMLADVSGKGIAAGMLSSFVKAGFDRSEPSPAKAITRLNQKFQELNQDEKAYITLAAVRIDGVDKCIHYSIAGHNAPILLKSGNDVGEIEMSAPPVSNWFESFSYEDKKLYYRTGDILVLLTDGVTESRNGAGEQFGIERVEHILLQSASAKEFIQRLQTVLQSFCGVFDDDITAIAFDL